MAGDEIQNVRQEEANAYIEKHQIMQLFNNMTSMLIYGRPDKPKEFLIDQLEKLQQAKTAQMDYPCLFDESNIRSIFGMLDPTKRGSITFNQYKEALQTIGVQEYDKDPPGADIDKISMDKFVREAQLGLLKTSATFKK